MPVLSAENLKVLLEIATMFAVIVAWFIRLEAKVKAHDTSFKEYEKRINNVTLSMAEDRKLLQEINLKMENVQTNLIWLVALQQKEGVPTVADLAKLNMKV